MTLSSSLVGLRPDGDLPLNLRHAASQPADAGRERAGKAAPKPCGSFARPCRPGLAGRCSAAGCPHPAVLGPWGQGVLRSRPQQHGSVPRCPVPLEREPSQLEGAAGPGRAPSGRGGEAGRQRHRAPGGGSADGSSSWQVAAAHGPLLSIRPVLRSPTERVGKRKGGGFPAGRQRPAAGRSPAATVATTSATSPGSSRSCPHLWDTVGGGRDTRSEAGCRHRTAACHHPVSPQPGNVTASQTRGCGSSTVGR